MVSTMIGIEIVPDRLHLCQVRGRTVTAQPSVPLPPGLVEQGRVRDPAALAAQIREALTAHGIRGRCCALVLPPEILMTRHVTLPKIRLRGARLDIAGEFRAMTDRPLSDYAFDSLLLSEGPDSIELYAAAAQKTPLEEYRSLLKRSGLTLMAAIPPEMAWRNLLLSRPGLPDPLCVPVREPDRIRLYFFSGGHFVTGRDIPHAGGPLDISSAEAIRRAVNLYNFSLAPGASPLQALVIPEEFSEEERTLLATGMTLHPGCPGGAAAGAALQEPRQGSMNLIVPQKDFEPRRMLPLMAVLAAFLLLFAKFGILDPLEEKARAYNALSIRQEQLAQANARLADYDSIYQNYLRYGESGMKDSETGLVSRDAILSLVEALVAPAAAVESLTLNNNMLTLDLSGITLDAAGDLASRLEQQPQVAHAGILSATAIDGHQARILLSLTLKTQEDDHA